MLARLAQPGPCLGLAKACLLVLYVQAGLHTRKHTRTNTLACPPARTQTLTEASMTVLARRTVSGATATLTRLTFRARRSLLQTGTIDTAYSITVPSSTSTEANTLAAAMVTTINSASSTGGSVSSIFPTSTLSSLGISGVGTASTTACTVAVCGAAAAAAGLSALIGAVLLAAVL